jgi:hypothetical protein
MPDFSMRFARLRHQAVQLDDTSEPDSDKCRSLWSELGQLWLDLINAGWPPDWPLEDALCRPAQCWQYRVERADGTRGKAARPDLLWLTVVFYVADAEGLIAPLVWRDTVPGTELKREMPALTANKTWEEWAKALSDRSEVRKWFQLDHPYGPSDCWRTIREAIVSLTPAILGSSMRS